jgi:hypothetical protein
VGSSKLLCADLCRRACVVSIARLTYASAVLTSYDPTCECFNPSVALSEVLADYTGDDAMPGILSGLEICTGIVACCSITYRPLIEKLFRSPSEPITGATGSSGSAQRGWNKISVQRDFTIATDSRTNLSQNQKQEEAQEWQLKTKGMDGRWV